MQKSSVPFFGNKKDNLHCFQACLRMALKHFLPKKNFTWEEIDTLTGFKKGKWTWATQALLNLHKMGFEIIDWDNFDAELFVRKGDPFFLETFGKEVGEAQVKYSDTAKERRLFRKYITLNIHEKKIPSLLDLRRFLDKGYLLLCNVNAYALDRKKGYSGHLVLVYHYTNTHILLHDPGLPARPDRRVSHSTFLKAWGYPTKDARNLIALKLSQSPIKKYLVHIVSLTEEKDQYRCRSMG